MDPGQAASRSALRRSLLEIHAAVFLFGFPGLFAKWLPLPPHLIVLGRVVFASLTLVLVLAAARQSLRIKPAGDVRLLLFCGVLLAVHWTLFFQSIQVSSVAVGLLAYASFPVFTALLEPLVTSERWDPSALGFAGIAAAGIVLMVPAFDLSNAVVRGLLWGLGAGVTFALLTLVNRTLAQRQSSLTVAFYQDLVAAAVLAPFTAGAAAALSARSLLLLAVLGIFGTAAAHTLFIGGMKRVKARTASLISALEPVYGIVLALLFLGERPSLRTLAGGTLILAAALVVTVRAGRGS